MTTFLSFHYTRSTLTLINDHLRRAELLWQQMMHTYSRPFSIIGFVHDKILHHTHACTTKAAWYGFGCATLNT